MSSSGKKLCPLLIEPNLQAGYGHPKDNENKTYQVLGVESMEKMQEGLQDPVIAKIRIDTGVNLDTQEIVLLVE